MAKEKEKNANNEPEVAPRKNEKVRSELSKLKKDIERRGEHEAKKSSRKTKVAEEAAALPAQTEVASAAPEAAPESQTKPKKSQPELENLTPDEREKLADKEARRAKKFEKELSPALRKDLEELGKLRGSAERIKCFAKIMDTYGADALVGLFSGWGDFLSSLVSGVYLTLEFMHSAGDNTTTTDYLKIIGYEALDFAIGSLPLVGDAADYFFKSNEYVAHSFENRTHELEQKLIAKMQKDGMSEPEITSCLTQVRRKATELPQLVDHAILFHKDLKERAATQAK